MSIALAVVFAAYCVLRAAVHGFSAFIRDSTWNVAELILVVTHCLLVISSTFFEHTNGDNSTFIRKVLLAPIIVTWNRSIQTVFEVSLCTCYDILPVLLLMALLLLVYGYIGMLWYVSAV